MSKTAIITGGNKGIGLAVAKDLISKNYKVIIGCRDTSKGKMAEEYLGNNAHFLELDLSKSASILRCILLESLIWTFFIQKRDFLQAVGTTLQIYLGQCLHLS